MIAYKKDYLVATATVPHSEWDTEFWTDKQFMDLWNEVYPNRTIMVIERHVYGYGVTFSVLCDEKDEIFA